tara:strand:- start:278 stop:478 length:201 start_codon:yes stop_codon:yes gene_type:complete
MEYRSDAFFRVRSNFGVMMFHNRKANILNQPNGSEFESYLLGSISAARHNCLSSAEKENQNDRPTS